MPVTSNDIHIQGQDQEHISELVRSVASSGKEDEQRSWQGQEEEEEIQQMSVFSTLPSELVVQIFRHMDIVTIFRFLDTCRYHRYLLLNMPDIWRRVRFIPISEYATMSSASSFLKPFRIPDMTSAEEEGSASSPLSALSTQFPKAQHQRRPRPSRRTRASTSESSSDSGESDKESSKDSENAAQRIQHAENQRDRERGGSRTLTSEIYAVLRRFRKENGLVNHVREIYMDGTDSDQYPSPLVMLIKFPHLEILSSRHRRKQTSLTTDIHTLKAMLRDGRVAPYSLRLRRWDIFHPYMTEMVEEDVAGFQGILNAISIVGAELNETRPPSEKEPASDSKKTKGVQLDIRLCHGPGRTRLASTAMSWINNTNGTFAGVGMHWGSATGQNTLGSQTETNTSTTTTHSSVAPPQICGNIVWTLERCRSCGTPQEQCHRCVDQCGTCHSLRAPPYVNHQLDMQRERSRYTNPASNHPRTTTTTTTTAPAVEPGHWNPTNLFGNRPRTPPGSISLSQMTNPLEGITSAYFRISQPLLGTQGSSVTPSIRVLDRPPEFSFFD